MAVKGIRIRIRRKTIYGYTLRADGLVRKDARGFTREVVFLAQLTAPRRTGALAESIKDRHQWANQYGCGRTVSIGVRYGRWVSEGTAGQGAGFITNGGKWMPVGRTQGNITTYKKAVHGQRANPFLIDAMRRTVRKYQH